MTPVVNNDGKYTPTWKDWLICQAKNLWYAVTDPIRLCYGRMTWKADDHITVVIPTRNRWDLLETRALPSLGAQTLQYFSVLVIDDAGEPTYATYYINGRPVRQERVQDKDIYYPNTPWGRWCAGPIQALNLARKYIKNEGWVLRMDDDDVLCPDALEKLLAWTKQYTTATGLNVELVSAKHMAKGGPVEPYHLCNHVIGGIQTTLCKAYVARLPYNKDCWRKSWDRMNDVDWVVRAVKAGVATSYLSEVVCNIDPRPNNTQVGWLGQKEEYGKDMSKM
jgi:glycosyltransferase involved in cell wall biosynthesis